MVTQHYFRVRGTYLLDDGTEPPPDFEGIAPEAIVHAGLRHPSLHHQIARAVPEEDRARQAEAQHLEDRSTAPASYWTTYDRNEVKDVRAAQVIAPIADDVLRLRDEIEAQTATRDGRGRTGGRDG